MPLEGLAIRPLRYWCFIPPFAPSGPLRGRLLVKLKGRQEELVVSRNYAELFRQM